MKCPTCGQICRTNRESCALCGTPFPKKRSRGGLLFALLVIVALALAALILWLLLQPAQPAESPERAAQPELQAQTPAPTPRADALFADAAQIWVRDSYILALRSDGTLALAGQSASPEFGFDLYDWSNIVQVIPDDYSVVALTGDGRVRMTGEVFDCQEAARWADVRQLCRGFDLFCGLTNDGRVLVTGTDSDKLKLDLDTLGPVAEMREFFGNIVVTTEDGQTLLLYSWGLLWADEDLNGVVDAVTNDTLILFLMEDGTVHYDILTRYCLDEDGLPDPSENVQNVRQIVAGAGPFALLEDGHVIYVGCYGDPSMPEVETWEHVRQLVRNPENAVLFGITEDGRVLTASPTEGEAPDLSAWENVVELQANWYYVVARTADGRVLVHTREMAPAVFDTADWDSVTAIALGRRNLAALRSDGAVLATGDNSCGQLSPAP